MKDWRSSLSANAEGASSRNFGVNLSGKRTVFSIASAWVNPCNFVSNFVKQRKLRLSELSLFFCY